MGLLDGFEKLINEHGSAVILKERIALANDKYTALEARVAGLEAEIVDLKAEKTALQAENERLKLDNEQLMIKVQNLEKISSCHTNLLHEVKTDILKLLFKQDKLLVDQIEQALGSESQTIQFHLEELKSNMMIKDGFTHGKYNQVFMNHSIGQEGRRYLIENNMIA